MSISLEMVTISSYSSTSHLSSLTTTTAFPSYPSRVSFVPYKQNLQPFYITRLPRVYAAKKEGDKDPIPSWAKPDSDELPPWASKELASKDSAGFEIPFFAYLLASAITAIAAIGSVFEYVNQKPVFGVLSSDSVFYAPVLGFFAFTGIPTSAYLWYKSVQVANKEAEEQDKRDGYL